MAPTIRALADRSDRPDELVAAGELLDMRFRDGGKALSLRAGKILHLLLKSAGAKICDDIEHRVEVAALRDAGIWHFTTGEVIEVIRELVGTVVELRVRTAAGREEVWVDPLLHGVRRPTEAGMDEPGGAIVFRLSATLRRMLQQSNHWALLSRRVLLSFESRYALRLYEVISLRVGLDHKTNEIFPLDDLRLRLGVPAKQFPRWQDLRRYVVERAVSEVNQLSGLLIGYEPIRAGKGVAAVRLTWGVRDATGRAAVARELEASRIGRKARRNGTVETIELPANGQPSQQPTTPAAEKDVKPAKPPISFPTSGTISYSRWADLVRQHAPAPTPDVDRVANAFRDWASHAGLPLGGPTVEKAFVTFCRNFRSRR